MRTLYLVYCGAVVAGLLYVNHHGMSVAHAYRAYRGYAHGSYYGHSYGGYNHK